MKASMYFMHGSETKLQLKLDASHYLPKFYILQGKDSVRLKSQSLEKEYHKLTFFRKWQHWKKTFTFSSALSYSSFSKYSLLSQFLEGLVSTLPQQVTGLYISQTRVLMKWSYAWTAYVTSTQTRIVFA